jgi:hypothetical protein
MENKFSVKLKVDLPAFPKFVEICERRNLLTHTGGIVSAKYIENCREAKISVADIQVGQKLTVDNKYYSSAVDVVCEIGIKLCWVLWRKFEKESRATADVRLNEFCYDLIVRRQYRLAEAILSFSSGVLKKGGSDSCRRMMVINWANAMRLDGRDGDAKKLLDEEDWSAVNDEFAVSVAAVKGDIEEVVRIMHRMGKDGALNAEDYRTWPVFRRIRTDARFKTAFSDIFGMPVISQQPELTVDRIGDAEIGPAEPTRH